MAQIPKIYPSQAVVEYAGHHFTHLVVRLRGAQTIAAVRETPEVWVKIQADRTYKVVGATGSL